MRVHREVTLPIVFRVAALLSICYNLDCLYLYGGRLSVGILVRKTMSYQMVGRTFRRRSVKLQYDNNAAVDVLRFRIQDTVAVSNV